MPDGMECPWCCDQGHRFQCMVLYLAMNPGLRRSLAISMARYGLFCCFSSHTCFITSLELSPTVTSSMAYQRTQYLGRRMLKVRKLGGIVAGGCS